MIDSITQYAKLANVTLADRVRQSEVMTTLNAATGIASEAGEINEIVKKEYFHEHPRTVEVVNHMEKELGDLVWYWALMCFAYKLDPAQVLQTNIDKLKARYPDGFSTERSMNRAPGDISVAPRGPCEKHQGENNHKAKLDRHAVWNIKLLISEGKGNEEIAQNFGVSRSTIWKIRHGKGWKHVQ